MAFTGTSKIEAAISQYGGGDQKYEDELRKHIREGMGYSNYVSRVNAVSGQDLDLGDIEGMTPAGIKSMVSGKADMQEQEIASLDKILGGVDTAAGEIASAQIARNKAAAAKVAALSGLDNKVAFETKDDLDVRILSYMQNPKNPDGSVKSLQQFEAETNAIYGEGMFGGQMEQGVLGRGTEPDFDLDTVKNRIAERLPSDFIGNEDKYHLMARGLSEKDAETNAGALKYDTMSVPDKVVFESEHPGMAKALEAGTMSSKAMNDIYATRGGGNKPANSFTDIVTGNKDISETELKRNAYPVYKNYAVQEVAEAMERSVDGELLKETFKEAYFKGADGVKDIQGIKDTPEFTTMLNQLKLSYSDIMNAGELETLAIRTILQSIK